MKSFCAFDLQDDDRCYIIAEAGINHNGSLEIAKELVRVAYDSGANCVKFQKRTVSRILTREGLDQPYTSERSFGNTYGEHKEFLEFSEDDFKELFRYATEEVQIHMTASGWDEEAIDFLCSLPVPFLKIASADLTNFPLLEHAAKKGLPLVLSTGMADMKTVEAAYELVSKYNDRISIMQCTSAYPAVPSDLHLNVIPTFQKRFPNAIIGYSGHEICTSATIAAVALGAKVVERHFTLDRHMKGGDHAASLEADDLAKLCKYIRTVEDAMGVPVKKMLPSEKECFIKLSKSIVSATPILKGTTITREMLVTKGPGIGISPMDMECVVGKVAICDTDEDVVLRWNTHICK